MKQFTIIEKCPNGARFALIPNRFKLLISIKNNMVFLDFIDEQSLETVFGTFFFIDDDSYKNFDDFTEEGQKLLLERLSEVIVADISSFISGEIIRSTDALTLRLIGKTGFTIMNSSLMMKIFSMNTLIQTNKQEENNDLVHTHSIYCNPLGYVHLCQGIWDRW